MVKRHNDNDDTNDVSPPEEPAATPLFSAADLDIGDYPVVHIPEKRLYMLQEYARRIADASRGSVENHRTGKVGEDAVAKPLGARGSIDLEVYADGGDGGVDLNHRGATIDVKTVGQHRSDPALTVDAYEQLRADYYVLASRISETDVRLVGYAPRQFVANAPVRSYRGGDYHFVEQDYLFPFPRHL
ncbi:MULTISPECIES: hypothetical protein [Haloferacaceae]|jgi:hypothetical protein|uniref:Protein NO VEIN C-terminal domain-containing protein n=1 Tax=Halorubrum glutamatedens TaxID=2707018 RepID=A0ABD5QWV9_9EURY|nr:hypothetical protein [Halobellus captivus]